MADKLDGAILAAAKDKIGTALKGKLSQKERLHLEVQELIVMFMMEDHPKTREMFPVYVWGRWVAAVAMVAFVGNWVASLFGK